MLRLVDGGLVLQVGLVGVVEPVRDLHLPLAGSGAASVDETLRSVSRDRRSASAGVAAVLGAAGASLVGLDGAVQDLDAEFAGGIG